MPRRVMFVGNQDALEFKPAVDWLQQHVALHCADDIAAGIMSLNNGLDADTILIAPSHRSEFSLDDVRRLQTASPVAQLYMVVGSWCEGETRSGHAWPGIERLYVHQLIPRALSDGWDRLTANSSSAPATASNDEHWLSRAIRAEAPTNGLVVICAGDIETRTALVELCCSFGFDAIGMKSPRGVDGNPMAVIYDADGDPEQRIRDLQRLSTRFPDAKVLTLLGYARHQEVRKAVDAGSHFIIEKPYDIRDVLACLRQDPH